MNRPALCGPVAFAPTGTAAHADEMSLFFGAMSASDYVWNGSRYSDGSVVQPYLEPGCGGFHAGAYASTIDADLTGADTGYGLSLGCPGALGSLSHDVGLAHDLYGDAFPGFPVDDYAGALHSGTLAVTETLDVTASAAPTPEYDQTSLSLRAGYCHDINVDPALGLLDTDGPFVAPVSIAFRVAPRSAPAAHTPPAPRNQRRNR